MSAHRRFTIAAVLVFSLVSASCASRANVRTTVLRTATTVHAAVAAIDDAERAFRCPVPAANPGSAPVTFPPTCISPSQHAQLRPRLIQLLEADKALALAGKAAI